MRRNAAMEDRAAFDDALTRFARGDVKKSSSS